MNYNLHTPDLASITKRFPTSPLVAALIASSSLSEEQIEELLHGSDTPTVSSAICVQKAAARILAAKKAGEKVFIGGDYDADGICSTAIMKDTLDKLGIANGYYIPNRFKEGYGLSASTVEAAAKKGYTLILTVDNGVRAFDAIAKAKKLGLSIIVTDHHEIQDPVPAEIVVHPDYMEPDYTTLSGAGVALQISRTLIGDYAPHTCLAAIAAIADVMPLWKETRRIVKAGMRLLNQNALPSASALLREGSLFDETSLSFQIIPKLNSVGRMNDISNVNTLVPFLLSRNPDTILRYAAQLNQVNEERRNRSRSMSLKAEKMVDEEDFQLIFDESFEEGICGLVAGRIAQETHHPTVILARSGNLYKGSGRSVAGFNLYDFFSDFSELSAFGGHAMAVGLSVPEEQYEPFCRHVKEKMKETSFIYEEPVPEAVLIPSDLITLDHVADLKLLSPYPKEMVPAVFAIQRPVTEHVFRSPKVVKYSFGNDSTGFDGVLYTRKGIPAPESPVFAAGPLSINRWRSLVRVQMDLEAVE